MGRLYHIHEANRPQRRLDDTGVRRAPPPGTSPAGVASLWTPGRLASFDASLLANGSRFTLWLSDMDRASEARHGAPVVLKTAHLGRNPPALDTLLDDALRAIDVRHPTLARLHEVGVEDNTFYAVAEHVRGRDLGQMLGGRCLLQPRADGSGSCYGLWPSEALPLDLALFIVMKVCEGLGRAHLLTGRAHGDLCPWHVMVGFGGEVKVLNFGLTPVTSLLKAEGIVESWAVFRYKAPEQMTGSPAAPAADIWSLGMVLYELIAGRPWLSGDADCGLLTAPRVAPRRDGSDLGLDLPAPVSDVLVRALSLDPAARYPTATEMALDLARAIIASSLAPSTTALARHMWRTFQHAE